MDFVLGVSIFLVSILFVFTFVPGTLQPFTQGPQAETAAADRVADTVVMDQLATEDDPYVLDGPCTAALLSDAAGTGCGFDGATLSSRLDLTAMQEVNVTMRGNPGGGDLERLCWDRSADEVVPASGSCDVSAGDVVLVTGEPIPQHRASVVTAKRIVRIDGTLAAVEVRMW